MGFMRTRLLVALASLAAFLLAADLLLEWHLTARSTVDRGADAQGSSREPVVQPTTMPQGGDCGVPSSAVVVMTKTDPPLKMAVYPEGSRDLVSHRIRTQGLWDGSLLQHVDDYMTTSPDPARSVVLDVGANVGMLSIYAASVGARVLAVEANPFNAALLAASACLNGLQSNISLYQTGLGTVPTWCSRRSGESESDGNMKLDCSPAAAEQARKDPTTAFRVVRLDALLPGPGARVGLLKVDVEGMEPEVMLGGAGLWATRGPPIKTVFECNAGSGSKVDTSFWMKFASHHSCRFDHSETQPPLPAWLPFATSIILSKCTGSNQVMFCGPCSVLGRPRPLLVLVVLVLLGALLRDHKAKSKSSRPRMD